MDNDKDKPELKKIQAELKSLSQRQIELQEDQARMTAKIIEFASSEGPKLLREYIKANKETSLRDSEDYRLIQTKELETIEKIDQREKTYRTGLIALAILVLGILAALDKAGAILPVMGVVLGGLLQFNPTFSLFNRKSSSTSKDVEDIS